MMLQVVSLNLSLPKFPTIPPRVNAVLFGLLMLSLVVNGLMQFHDFPWNGNPFKWADAEEQYVGAMKDRSQFELEKATIKLKKAINIYDKDARFYVALGDCQLRLNRYADAQASLEKATALDKRNAFAWIRLSRALAAQGKMQDAVKAVHTALDASPGDAVANAQLGLLLASLGHTKEAAKIFDDLRSMERDKAEYWCLLGRYYLLQHKLQETEGAFRQAVSKDPNEPEYAEWLGLALQSLDKPDEAEEWLETACKLNSHNADYWMALANLRLRDNNAAAAVEALQHVLKEEPEQPQALKFLGMALLSQQRFAEAEVALRSSLEENAADQDVRNAYTNSLLMQGKLAQLERLIESWMQDPTFSSSAAPWIFLGDVYGFDGKPEAARGAYKKALTLNPPGQLKAYAERCIKSPTTPEDLKALIAGKSPADRQATSATTGQTQPSGPGSRP